MAGLTPHFEIENSIFYWIELNKKGYVSPLSICLLQKKKNKKIV